MPAKKLEFTITAAEDGERLDRCLSRLIQDSSRAYLQKLIKGGLVRCNGEIVEQPRFAVRTNMHISLELEEPQDTTPVAEEFRFEILYEDDMMLAINKPPGVVVHPAAGNPDGTVVNALLGRYPELAQNLATGNCRPGIVHRLDKDTSGCLVAAKTAQAQFRLANSFAERQVHKTYLALVKGIPQRLSGHIENCIGRHPVNRQKMAVVERNGKLAITEYTVLASGNIRGVAASLLAVKIFTGRTHQIRVHMSDMGHPILGDEIYGGKNLLELPRQMLHAWKLEIPHPSTGEMLSFEAALPEDFKLIKDELMASL